MCCVVLFGSFGDIGVGGSCGNKMKIIGGIDNHTANSEATTAQAMRDAGYEWDDEKGYWRKEVNE